MLDQRTVLVAERDELLSLGWLVATRSAINASVELAGSGLLSRLVDVRHHAGDWGELGP